MLIILIIYFVFVILWIIGSGVAIYHNIEYYDPKSKMKLGIYIYVWASVAILLFSFFMLYQVNWSEPIEINF
ncbi:MAG: hypothetical protein Q7S53_04820 [bacterium]|nr:hypothetical protein [bacterium]